MCPKIEIMNIVGYIYTTIENIPKSARYILVKSEIDRKIINITVKTVIMDSTVFMSTIVLPNLFDNGCRTDLPAM